MFSYFAKILKSFEYQSVLKVYYPTKNRQKWANLVKIRKTQISDYQHYIFFLFLLFSLPCTGSGYNKSPVNYRFTGDLSFSNIH